VFSVRGKCRRFKHNSDWPHTFKVIRYNKSIRLLRRNKPHLDRKSFSNTWYLRPFFHVCLYTISANILCRIFIKFGAGFLYLMPSSKHELHEYVRTACHILLGHKWIYTRNSQISWPISVKFHEESQAWCRWSIIRFVKIYMV
jgi:hypothetical protein